jgi:hypothetical protein
MVIVKKRVKIIHFYNIFRKKKSLLPIPCIETHSLIVIMWNVKVIKIQRKTFYSIEKAIK